MKRYTLGLFTWLALLTISYSSCTQESEPVDDSSSNKPVMREVSELVALMFKMEGDLKLLRSGLIDEETYTPPQSFDYEDIFTAQASKDVLKDSVYVVNGTSYLKELHQLSQHSVKDSAVVSFNNVVDACVTCHLSYCPGSVARIKKLKI